MLFRLFAVICVGCALAIIPACSSMPNVPPLTTVDSVDIEQYMGKWYEIASYETFFNRNCTGTTAEYTLRDDGTVEVVNECRIGSLDGRLDRIEGTATVANTDTNAELKVSFFFFAQGDYWIIDLDEDYQWAVVGDPRRSTLFVLSRTPTMDDETYQGILTRIAGKCYDTSILGLTPQAEDAEG